MQYKSDIQRWVRMALMWAKLTLLNPMFILFILIKQYNGDIQRWVRMAFELAFPSKPFNSGIERFEMASELASPSKPSDSGIERPN